MATADFRSRPGLLVAQLIAQLDQRLAYFLDRLPQVKLVNDDYCFLRPITSDLPLFSSFFLRGNAVEERPGSTDEKSRKTFQRLGRHALFSL